MNEYEKTKKSLETILEKGDLFDIISLKENKTLRGFAHSKAIGLLFSRLFLTGVLITEKIKSKSSPVEEIKKAQDQIRENLKLTIDIIVSKHYINALFTKKKEPYLSLLYQNEGVEQSEYLENLKKILEFCKLYKIEEILLKRKDIRKILKKQECNYEKISLAQLLKNDDIKVRKKDALQIEKQFGFYYNIEKEMKEIYFFLSLTELEEIIKKIESKNLASDVLQSFKILIKDGITKKAIEEYLENKDKDKLKEIIYQRLSLFLNDAASYKDKQLGKVYLNIKVDKDKVYIEIFNKEGKKINNIFLSLYDYLEVKDYENILKKIEMETEDKDKLLLTILYLYLVENRELIVVQEKNDNFLTIYDYFYKAYQLKEQKKIKKIPGLYSFSNRMIMKWCLAVIKVLGCHFYLILISVIIKNSYKFLENPSFFKEETFLESVANDYKKIKDFSVEWEIKLLTNEEFRESLKENLNEAIANALENLPKNITKINEERKSIEESNQIIFNRSIGDTENELEVKEENKEKIYAEIIPLKENVTLPSYFAYTYAFDSYYFSGQKSFVYANYTLQDLQIYDKEPLFRVTYNISKSEINHFLNRESFRYLETFYPVGSQYVITSVIIKDDQNSENFVILDSNYNLVLPFTEKEKEQLAKMESATISYTYGISKDVKNSFVENIQILTKGNVSRSSKEIKSAIKKGLGLDDNASIEEVFKKIKEKKYSITPLKDAGLLEAIKEMDEVEYFETLASLDSLVCNIATALAVEADETLVYIVGFLNTDDEYITQNEAHAWAMSKEGQIIDVTPSILKQKEKNTLKKIMDWGIDHKISLVGLALLITIIAKKKYGKKIRFEIRMSRTEKLLESKDMPKSYANLNKFLYDAECSKVKREPEEWLETLNDEFYAYRKDDLKALKRELQQTKEFQNCYLKSTIKLMNQIPFIKENKEELKRNLQKKKYQN